MSTHHEVARDVGTAVIKTIPPVAVWSVTANGWLAIVSIFYVLLQSAYLVWKWRRDVQKRAEDRAEIAALMRGPIAQPGQKAPK